MKIEAGNYYRHPKYGEVLVVTRDGHWDFYVMDNRSNTYVVDRRELRAMPTKKPKVTYDTPLHVGDKLVARDDVEVTGLVEGEVYTFRRWANGSRLELEEFPLGYTFKPERFVRA